MRREHFEAERELAERLRRSTRAQRPALLRTMYDELQRQVPDHPRLNRHFTRDEIRAHIQAQRILLNPWLNKPDVFLEFAPGAGYLAADMCREANRVRGIDISNQLTPEIVFPENFKLLIYDGYNLELPDNSVDLAFSYQMLEHVHPEDVPLHFQLVCRLLRQGGCYIFATPHSFSGPHDISRGFSDIPRGFHLKEWTYTELITMLDKAGFQERYICRRGRYYPEHDCRDVLQLEKIAGLIPLKLRRIVCRRLFAGIVMAIRKS